MPLTPVFQRTILLRGEACIYEEVCGSSAIKPGMLVNRMLGQPGNTVVVVPHAVAGGRGANMFATEQVLNGGGTVDTAYAAGDIVRLHIAKSGDIVNVLVASGASLQIGTPLISNAAGKFVASATMDSVVTTQKVFGEALIDVATGTLAADTLVPMLVW